MPLDSLRKQYAGAYADGFEWPQPGPNSDDDDVEETQGAFPDRIFTLFFNAILEII